MENKKPPKGADMIFYGITLEKRTLKYYQKYELACLSFPHLNMVFRKNSKYIHSKKVHEFIVASDDLYQNIHNYRSIPYKT